MKAAVKTGDPCHNCRRHPLMRETLGEVTWTWCERCDKTAYQTITRHLIAYDGIVLCDEPRNDWDVYEPLSRDEATIHRQVYDDDTCVGCADGWNAGVGEDDEDDYAVSET